MGSDPIAQADRFLTDHPGIHKLLVVDSEDHLRGLFTMSDIERISQERLAQVKPAAEVKEPWDYVKILKTIPAEQAFRQPSADCKM